MQRPAVPPAEARVYVESPHGRLRRGQRITKPVASAPAGELAIDAGLPPQLVIDGSDTHHGNPRPGNLSPPTHNRACRPCVARGRCRSVRGGDPAFVVCIDTHSLGRADVHPTRWDHLGGRAVTTPTTTDHTDGSPR